MSRENESEITNLQMGELLIKKGFLRADQLAAALADQRATGRIIGEILIQKGFVSSKIFYSVLAGQLGKPFVDFQKIKIQRAVLDLIPKRLVYEHKIFPLVQREDKLLIAVSNPHDIRAEAELIKLFPQFEIHTAIACPQELRQALEIHYGPL